MPDGTPVVSLFTEDDTGNTVHIQQFLIKSGHAFVWPSSRNQVQLAVLYRLEEEARLQKKGLWASEHYHPRQVPDDFLQAGRFMLVHGTVQSSQTVKATHYLNFGADWRKDFTAELPRRIWQDIPDGESFTGKNIEVRGWVDLRGGPRILVRNPYQIRLLNQPANIEAKPD
ncbi:hypothetical protein GCM10017044_05690 [Kordiimonas sediminis]|uniref:TNase-like domain-containing protein n=1 Tax=Kordiimonas sediminis TaxID=1735581 RepID=A0A919ALH5_9PROT|nr:hypothetical protein GCM10017044_05690 [Kordiimonas sediminis]